MTVKELKEILSNYEDDAIVEMMSNTDCLLIVDGDTVLAKED